MASIEALRGCELFVCLEEEELEQVAAIAHAQTYQAGDLILGEREPANHLFILRTGRVRVQMRLRSFLEPPEDVTIEEVEPGRVFGWSSLVKQARFTASVRALEPVTLLVFDPRELQALFDQNAHIGFVVMKQLAEVIASRLRHIRSVCELRAEEDQVPA